MRAGGNAQKAPKRAPVQNWGSWDVDGDEGRVFCALPGNCTGGFSVVGSLGYPSGGEVTRFRQSWRRSYMCLPRGSRTRPDQAKRCKSEEWVGVWLVFLGAAYLRQIRWGWVPWWGSGCCRSEVFSAVRSVGQCRYTAATSVIPGLSCVCTNQ